jgi:hypothetical protein
MARRSVDSKRHELPDGFLGEHHREGKEKRKEKFKQVGEKATDRKRKKADSGEKEIPDVKFRKRKSRKIVDDAEKSKPALAIDPTPPEMETVEIDESLVKEIKKIEKRIVNISDEIEEDYHGKPFLSKFHSKEVSDFMERGAAIFDSLQNLNNYSKNLVGNLDSYLAEGMLILNGLRRIYKKNVSDRDAGGEEIYIKEEGLGPKQLDADINHNFSPVYSREETPEDSLEYQHRRKYSKKAKLQKTTSLENNLQEQNDIANKDEENDKPPFIDQEEENKSAEPSIEEITEEKEPDEVVSFVAESYLKSASEMIKIVRKSGFYNLSPAEEKEHIRKYLQEAMDGYGKETEEEKMEAIDIVLNKLFKN